MAYLVKTRTVEPEKQPLLANGSEATFVSGQRPRNTQRNDCVARQQILNKQDYTAAVRDWLAKHVLAETVSIRE
jgi:hypothetical protein